MTVFAIGDKVIYKGSSAVCTVDSEEMPCGQCALKGRNYKAIWIRDPIGDRCLVHVGNIRKDER